MDNNYFHYRKMLRSNVATLEQANSMYISYPKFERPSYKNSLNFEGKESFLTYLEKMKPLNANWGGSIDA